MFFDEDERNQRTGRLLPPNKMEEIADERERAEARAQTLRMLVKEERRQRAIDERDEREGSSRTRSKSKPNPSRRAVKP